MKEKMRYYVILTIMAWGDSKGTNQFRPAIVKRPLFWPSDVDMCKEYVSRKYCGILSFEQLIQLLVEIDFSSTSDSLGALCEYGWLSAVSFEKDEENYWAGSYGNLNAYISPLYSDELMNKFGYLSEENKLMVNSHENKVLNWLKESAIDEAHDIKYEKMEAPSFMDGVYFDFDQLTIPEFFNHEKS